MYIKRLVAICAIVIISACTTSPSKVITTITSSPTQIRIISLSTFIAERIGLGTHGNMACISYQGDAKDIEKLNVVGSFIQEGKRIESEIELTNIDDRYCFEMVDFLYKPKFPVNQIINISNKENNEDIVIENNTKQEYDLGEYQVVPCLNWIFGIYGIDRHEMSFRNGHRQWDLAYSNDQYPNSVGLPIYAPSDGYVVNYTDTVPNQKGTVTNLQMYLPQLGLILNVGHINPENHMNIGDHFSAGDQIAVIDIKQGGSSRPHTHLGINTTEIPPKGNPWGAADEDNWINPFSADLFETGLVLSTGLWLPENLPQQIIDMFSQTYFMRYSIKFIPLLSTTTSN